MHKETGIDRVRKLRWKCRRGMKELDILMEGFVNANEPVLVQGGWPEFEQLLALEDDQLWDCMRQPGNPDFSGFQELTAAIRGVRNTNS